jgi:hypothetical protein
MFDLVVNLSRTSRDVGSVAGSVAGDLANLRPECRHVIKQDQTCLILSRTSRE